MKNILVLLYAFLLLINFPTVSFGQQDSLTEKNSFLPLGQEWFSDKDVNLPLPFGVSAFFTYMNRDINISDVGVSFNNQPKQSINDFANFGLTNHSVVSAVKFDVWLIPFLNLYGLVGNVSTNASLDAKITIDRIIFPGPPMVLPINNQSSINGLYFGTGITLVAGYKKWFILGDINYGFSNLDEFDGKIDFWMYSARSGFQSTLGRQNMRTWIGFIYLSSHRTLHLNIENETLGLVHVEINQETRNPLTIQLGSSLSFGKQFEVLVEMGTNFEDASIGVITCSYRF